MTPPDLTLSVAANGCSESRVGSPTFDGAELAALPGHVLARHLHRHLVGAQYVEGALDSLECDLLSTQVDDITAHRVHNILRAFRRLTDGPPTKGRSPLAVLGWNIVEAEKHES